MPINVEYNQHDGLWAVWTDPEHGVSKTGRCLAIGPNFETVKREAIGELVSDIVDLQGLKENPNNPGRVL